MSEEYIAANGQIITNDMIERWCESYERGEFPEGERSSGRVIQGRPPLSSEGSAVISVKVPTGMKKALEQKAQSEGVSMSSLVRSALADRLLAG